MVLGTSRPTKNEPIHVGVFLKAPFPGRVKTRLAADLGDDAACELYRNFVADTLGCVPQSPEIRPVVFYHPPEARSACVDLIPPPPVSDEDGPRSHAFFRPVQFVPQPEGTLGDKMSAALDELFSRGAEKAALVGTDCPLLDRSIIVEASHALEKSDLVLGPANDGGYYLIAMSSLRLELFDDIPWSTDAVLAKTRVRARESGLVVRELRELVDVDEVSDLRLLVEELRALGPKALSSEHGPLPRQTLAWLLQNGYFDDRKGPVKRRSSRRKGKA